MEVSSVPSYSNYPQRGEYRTSDVHYPPRTCNSRAVHCCPGSTVAWNMPSSCHHSRPDIPHTPAPREGQEVLTSTEPGIQCHGHYCHRSYPDHDPPPAVRNNIPYVSESESEWHNKLGATTCHQQPHDIHHRAPISPSQHWVACHQGAICTHKEGPAACQQPGSRFDNFSHGCALSECPVPEAARETLHVPNECHEGPTEAAVPSIQSERSPNNNEEVRSSEMGKPELCQQPDPCCPATNIPQDSIYSQNISTPSLHRKNDNIGSNSPFSAKPYENLPKEQDSVASLLLPSNTSIPPSLNNSSEPQQSGEKDRFHLMPLTHLNFKEKQLVLSAVKKAASNMSCVKMFQDKDRLNSGKIGRRDFQIVMDRIGVLNGMSSREIDAVFKGFSTQKETELDYKRFAAACTHAIENDHRLARAAQK